MARTKTELLDEAKKLNLEVTAKNTIKQIQEAIDGADQAEPAIEEAATEEPKIAKAGKRSAKALAEEAEKQAKEEKKASTDEASVKPKKAVKPTRSRLERRGKKFRKAAELIDKTKNYSVSEATKLIQKTTTTKFDSTIELHVNLNVDPRQADQNIRDSLVLPAGTGKTVKIAVFSDDKIDGVELAGIDTITKALDKGMIDFDILISTPANMAKLGKYARVLGPRGLMPNPKSGTVTNDIASAVKQSRAGRMEYRVDSTGIVHVGVGKASFTDQDIEKNIQAVIQSIKGNKPSSIKGSYVKAAYLTSTMGPSVAISISEF